MAKRRSGSTLVQRSRRTSPEAKALIHQVKGRVTRPFLGLTPDEIAAIGKRIDEGIRRNVGRASS